MPSEPFGGRFYFTFPSVRNILPLGMYPKLTEVLMEYITTTLDKVPVGESVLVSEIGNVGTIRRRLMDMGFVGGSRTVCIGESPLGDPRAFLIDGAVIALRRSDCADIFVRQGDELEERND